MNLNWTMDFWLCFWLALISVTHVTATSRRVTENNTLTVINEDFKSVSDYYCEGNYKNLHTIHLVQNNLSFLEARAFDGVSNLKHLLITHNLLESLDPNLFSNLKELISLDLSYNKLKSFTNEQLFNSQSKLMVLRLSHNEIISLDSRVLMPLQSLKELNLTNNPFYCDCKLSNAVKWCAERNLTTGAKCNNGPLWTEFKYENCTSYYKEESFPITGIMIGTGIITAIIVCFLVLVCGGLSLYCWRRATRNTTTNFDRRVNEIKLYDDIRSNDYYYYETVRAQMPRYQSPVRSSAPDIAPELPKSPQIVHTELYYSCESIRCNDEADSDSYIEPETAASDEQNIAADIAGLPALRRPLAHTEALGHSGETQNVRKQVGIREPL